MNQKISKGERRIQDILDAAGVPYKREYTYKDLISTSGRPLRFDFAVLLDDGEVDFLIEYQGEQHYKPVSKFHGKTGLSRQRFNDNMKRRYCAERGITLIEIPYSDYDILTYDYIIEKSLK